MIAAATALMLACGGEQKSATSSAPPTAEAALDRPLPLRLLTVSPESCKVGEQFRVQPNGDRALVLSAEHATRLAVLNFDGHPVQTFSGPEFISANIPAVYLQRPGVHELVLTEGDRHSNSLKFVVQP